MTTHLSRLREERGIFVCSPEFNIDVVIKMINEIGPKFTAVKSSRTRGIFSSTAPVISTALVDITGMTCGRCVNKIQVCVTVSVILANLYVKFYCYIRG